jgi:hypothetical protein
MGACWQGPGALIGVANTNTVQIRTECALANVNVKGQVDLLAFPNALEKKQLILFLFPLGTLV